MVHGRATRFVSDARADAEGEEAIELGGSAEEVKNGVLEYPNLMQAQKLFRKEAFLVYRYESNNTLYDTPVSCRDNHKNIKKSFNSNYCSLCDKCQTKSEVHEDNGKRAWKRRRRFMWSNIYRLINGEAMASLISCFLYLVLLLLFDSYIIEL